MSYRINEIFYSLQGEGHNTGRAAVFVRFAGCNLKCPFCDTEFARYKELTTEEILTQIANIYHPTSNTQRPSLPLIVLTGGEPTLQVDESFIDRLHEVGYEVAMESNGTHLPPFNLDWLTISPKQNVVVERCNELKCIFDMSGDVNDFGIQADYYYLQPCDTRDATQNHLIIQQCIDYIKRHPRWRLSLQTHKLVGFK
ncbi:MAG: radical SAM protein [Prevotella sp.]|nr:radical SAM protein [Prevotella sp.]